MTPPNHPGKLSSDPPAPVDDFWILAESRDSNDLPSCKTRSLFRSPGVKIDVCYEREGEEKSDDIDGGVNDGFHSCHQYGELLANTIAKPPPSYCHSSSSSSSSSLSSSSSSSSSSSPTTTTSTQQLILQCSSCKPRLFILFLLLSAHVSQATSNIGGVFEVQLISFGNDQAPLDDGSCCSRGVGGRCFVSCDVIFVLCLGHFMATIPPEPDCSFGSHVTEVYNQNARPVYQLPFAFAWPGDFLLVIRAIHSSEEESSQATPTERRIVSSDNLVHEATLQRSLNTSAEWMENVSYNNFSNLRFRYRVVCPKNQYGPGCTVTCISRDDELGHYRCKDDGSRVCLPGWTGEYCRTHLCDCRHGYCKSPNECTCQEGWVGKRCDQCKTYPGCLHGTCNEAYQCNCKDGWNGQLCDIDLNFCSKYIPCGDERGSCLPNPHSNYTCRCYHGFEGEHCEIEASNCRKLNQDCLNGGKCLYFKNEHRCECTDEYEGKRCGVKKNSTCLDRPCNNSTCVSGSFGGGRRYKCLCPPGYTGPNCDQNVNECISQPCRNGGKCVDEIDSFTCLCPSQFIGKQCEIKSDCSNKLCHNGGVCVEMRNGGGTRCDCQPGFYGELCQNRVDHCLMNPCTNGATCEDLIHTYHCKCLQSFTGKNCATKTDFCAGRPCLNGGTCNSGVDTYQCHCPPGFHGTYCEIFDSFSTHSADSHHNISKDGIPGVPEPGIFHFVVALVLGIFFALVAVGIIISVWWMKRQRCLQKARKVREKSDLAIISIEQVENDFNKSLNNMNNFDKSSQKMAPEEVNLFLKSMDEEGKDYYDHPDFGLNFQRNQLHLNKHRPRHKSSTTNDDYYHSKVPTRYKEINQDAATVHKAGRHTEV